MPRIASGLVACFLIFSACLSAVELKGKITDQSGAPIPGAQVALVNRVGVVAQTTAGTSGGFLLDAPQTPDTRLVVTAPGFLTRTLALDEAASVQLEIAPRLDTVQVVGSTIELPASLQGSSVDVIPSGRVRSSNEPFAMDLLRYLPGVAFNQSGSPGGVTSLFLRGGNSLARFRTKYAPFTGSPLALRHGRCAGHRQDGRRLSAELLLDLRDQPVDFVSFKLQAD